MTTLTASRRAVRFTLLDRMLLATAAALDGFVIARHRRRTASFCLHAYQRSVAEEQRDRVGAVAARLLPR